MSGEATSDKLYLFCITYSIEVRKDPHFYRKQNEIEIKFITSLITKVTVGGK